MIFSIIHYLRGFLELRLTGTYIERFLNLCVKNGIYLWHIRKKSDTEARTYVSVPGFRRMRVAARKTGTRIRILRKRGLPLFLHRHRRRKAFLIGMLLFAVIVAVLSSFIWSVEIDGTEKIDKNLIRNTLRSCGLDVGVIKYTLKASDIKADMLRELPSLSWLWVEIKGTRALVHVREKTLPPDIVPLHRPCNIVAKKDGVIVDFAAKRGEMAVETGIPVQKGALLISGTVKTKHGGTLMVHAEGSVHAKTWYTKTGTFPLKAETDYDSGESRRRFALCIGDFSLPLHGKKQPYETFRSENKVHRWHLWGDLYFPVSVSETVFFETRREKMPMMPDEATLYYGNKLLEETEIPPDAEIINTEFTHILNENGNISVTLVVECIEEIGETREILEGTQNDGTIF